MNIYYFYDSKTTHLVNQYFLPSLKKHNPHLNPIGKILQDIPNSNFGSLGFRSVITEKVDQIIKIIETESSEFLVSDIDIEFFKSIDDFIRNIPKNIDIIFQAEGIDQVNTGFMLIKPNTKTLNFWKKIFTLLKSFDQTKFINEQILANKELKYGNVDYAVFPKQIWNWTLSSSPPQNIALHHANCTKNIRDKLHKLEYVRKLYSSNDNITTPKKYKPQIVVARYKENVDWILTNNWQNRCIVYNKGTDKLSPKLNALNKPNYPVYGREGETYLYHILSNYKNLPEYTIFTQGTPFEHSPYFCEIIKFLDTYGYYRNFQPLTSNINQIIPPKNLIYYDKSLYINDQYPVCLELLNENLEPVMYIDHDWYGFEKSFRLSYNLSLNSKLFPLLPFIYDKLQLINKKPYTGFIKWNYGAIFGVSRDRILQHDKKFYENLYQFVIEYPSNVYILERMWYTIFS